MGSISNLNNNSISANQSLWQSLQTQNQTTTAAQSASSGSDQANVSPLGQLFQQLTQLQNSNPTEFKQLASQAASQLTTAAGQATDPNQAQFLDSLASKFQDASQSGNLSAFDPSSSSTATEGHHHHHHHGGGAESSSSTSTDSTDALSSILTGTSGSTTPGSTT